MNWLDEGLAKEQARRRDEDRIWELGERIKSQLATWIGSDECDQIYAGSVFRRVQTPDIIRTYLDDFLARAGDSPAVWDTTGFVGPIEGEQIAVADIGEMVYRMVAGKSGFKWPRGLTPAQRKSVVHRLLGRRFVETHLAKFRFGTPDGIEYDTLLSRDGGWWAPEQEMRRSSGVQSYGFAVNGHLVEDFTSWAIRSLA